MHVHIHTELFVPPKASGSRGRSRGIPSAPSPLPASSLLSFHARCSCALFQIPLHNTLSPEPSFRLSPSVSLFPPLDLNMKLSLSNLLKPVWSRSSSFTCDFLRPPETDNTPNPGHSSGYSVISVCTLTSSEVTPPRPHILSSQVTPVRLSSSIPSPPPAHLCSQTPSLLQLPNAQSYPLLLTAHSQAAYRRVHPDVSFLLHQELSSTG